MAPDAVVTSLSSVPVHAAGAELLLRADGAELRMTGRPPQQLDDIAVALWDVCDGETTVAEIVDAICSVFDATADVVAHDVVHALAALTAGGMLHWRPAPG